MTAGTAVGIGDADGDGDADLYVVQGGMGRNAADRLLLNRGDGRAFRSVAIPQARGGSADDVAVAGPRPQRHGRLPGHQRGPGSRVRSS